MSSALQTCADRITAALEYLTNEQEREHAIRLAVVQLQHAQASLEAARNERLAAGAITFSAADAIDRNPWPPLETDEREARSYTEVRGRMVVAHVESLLEQLP
jgi:hypothetical protein